MSFHPTCQLLLRPTIEGLGLNYVAPSNEYSAGPKNFASHNLTDDGAAKSQAAKNSVDHDEELDDERAHLSISVGLLEV